MLRCLVVEWRCGVDAASVNALSREDEALMAPFQDAYIGLFT